MVSKVINLFLYINKYIKTVMVVILFSSSNIVISKSQYEYYLTSTRNALTASIFGKSFYQKNSETTPFGAFKEGFWVNIKIAPTNPSFLLLQIMAKEKDLTNNEILGTEKISYPELESLIIKTFSDLDINPEDIKLRAIKAESCEPMLSTGQAIWVGDGALWLNQDYLMNNLTLVEREAAITLYCCILKHYSLKKIAFKAIVTPVVTATAFYGLSYLIGDKLNSAVKNNFDISDKTLAWAPYVGVFLQTLINKRYLDKNAYTHCRLAFDTYVSKYDSIALKSYFQKMLDIAGGGAHLTYWIDKIDTFLEDRESSDDSSDLNFNSEVEENVLA